MQTAAAVGAAVVGPLLVVAFRGFHRAGSNEMAGFLLGVPLLALGLAGLVTTGTQTVTIDPALRRITVEDTDRFGSKERLIPFGDVASVHIGFLGKPSNYVKRYYLVLRLSNGAEYSLFAPGRFYAGASERSTVEGWPRRLEGCLAAGQDAQRDLAGAVSRWSG